ncbi:MAG: hypothetical protein C4519_20130 [Desulfobacteraceae bacterium]|nr:MAG: hypothetical protein C4519_20130 [Desulfobacteraceae bacterium]
MHKGGEHIPKGLFTEEASMIRLEEGQVGFAKNHEELMYPSVTSCLTITCVLADGGKWGAHMSIKPYQNNFPHNVILPELRTGMSTAKALDKVAKVWIVGILDLWATYLGPRKDPNEAIKSGNDESMKKTRDRLVDLLGLRHLSGKGCGVVPGESTFVFMNMEGNVKFGTGSASEAIEVEF